MSLRRDERAVTVQIGAVLLLAIIFAALALYQVNVVPAENGAVESEHNRQVSGEMQELRNAIRNTGTTQNSQSVSVTLGTQYPTRTFSMNPPDPSGTLETTGERTLRIENAVVVDGDSYEGNGDPNKLVGTHTTTTLEYEPDYNEYRNAPTTRIEHSYVFNDFADASVSVTDQRLADEDSISITLLEGSLSKAGSGAVSIDTKTVSGPTDPVTIEPEEGADHINITLPTSNPAQWIDEIGKEWGENGIRVDDSGDDFVTLALENESYELRMSRVSITGDGERDDEFDIRNPDRNGQGGANQAFAADWKTESATMTAGDQNEEFDLTVSDRETGDPIEDASVEFTTRGESGVSIDRAQSDNQTDENGTATVVVDANSAGSTAIYGSSGDATAKLDIAVEESGPGSEAGNFSVSIDRADGVSPGDEIEVAYTITNDGEASDTQDIEFTVDGALEAVESDVTIAPGGTYSGVFAYGPDQDDRSNVIVGVSSDDDGGTREVAVEGTAQFDVDIAGTNSPVEEGDQLTVDATVVNTGDGAGAQPVVLEIDGTVVDEGDGPISLQPGEETTITRTWDETTQVEHEATIASDDDSESVTVFVEPPGVPGFTLSAVLVVSLLVAAARRRRARS